MAKSKWVLQSVEGDGAPAVAEVSDEGLATIPTAGVWSLEHDPVPVIENGEETAHGIAVHLAAILRSVADAPLEPPLDPMTWRAAMLAAARIVEEDDALRGGRA